MSISIDWINPPVTGPRQLLVENYFAASTTLPAEYWMGIMREGSSNPYMYVTGQLVAANVSAAQVLPLHRFAISQGVLTWSCGRQYIGQYAGQYNGQYT